jgi:hypothetical protein
MGARLLRPAEATALSKVGQIESYGWRESATSRWERWGAVADRGSHDAPVSRVLPTNREFATSPGRIHYRLG